MTSPDISECSTISEGDLFGPSLKQYDGSGCEPLLLINGNCCLVAKDELFNVFPLLSFIRRYTRLFFKGASA